MRQRKLPAIAANRFGLGARPGDLSRIGGDAHGWLTAQLAGGPPRLDGPDLRGATEVLAQVLELRRQRRAAREESLPERAIRARMPDGAEAAKRDVMKLGELYRPIYVSDATARVRAAVATERPFIERLTHFWTNHFAVSVDKLIVLGLAGSFEREAIRPNVLGKFADLLLAVERHQAMLLYLDNHLSIGPGSRAAQRVERRGRDRRPGINENLAREILELHTLGVNGGYRQSDVTALAQVLTGWSISGFGPASRGEPGSFQFRPELHEPGAKVVLGKRYPDDGFAQGQSVLRDLAAHPATARFIATKLARHFIADEPRRGAIEHIERAFLDSGGDLPTVYRALLSAPDAWSEPFAKFKTPSEFVISTYRGLQLPVDPPRRVLGSFELLGQRTYSPGSPAGWPDRGADWDGASALLKRIEWAEAVAQHVGRSRSASELAPELLGDTLTSSTHTAIKRAASASQALTLLLTSPEFLRR